MKQAKNTIQLTRFGQKNKKKVKLNLLSIFITLFLVLLAICLIVNPKKYISSCYNGLSIWATCVLPSLLPFFVITKLLSELKVLDKFFNKFAKLNKFLFNAPSCSGYIFGMSIISGYPVGAKLICDFYENKIITEKQANKLVTFCSTSGPLFIIGTVGAIMMKNALIGYILYASHIISAILNGIIYRKAFLEKDTVQAPNSEPLKTDYQSLLSTTMTSSITSVMVVGGFVAMFFMIIDILGDTHILFPFEWLINSIFSCVGSKNIGSYIVNGLIEVTRGCRDIASLGLNPTISSVILSGLIGFGGMSIHLQSLSFLTRCKVNIKFYFLQKITQTIFACASCYLLCLILIWLL